MQSLDVQKNQIFDYQKLTFISISFPFLYFILNKY